MEPEGSLPRSQQLDTGPYPELDWIQPMPSQHSPLTSIFNLFPSTRRSSEWFPSFRFSNQNSVCISGSPMRLHASLTSMPLTELHYKNNGQRVSLYNQNGRWICRLHLSTVDDVRTQAQWQRTTWNSMVERYARVITVKCFPTWHTQLRRYSDIKT